MAKTVTQVLTAATDSVTLIDAVDGGTHDVSRLTQAQKNDMVDRNVTSLEWRMSIDAIAADATSKTPYTNAIAAGKTYIEDNS